MWVLVVHVGIACTYACLDGRREWQETTADRQRERQKDFSLSLVSKAISFPLSSSFASFLCPVFSGWNISGLFYPSINSPLR